MKRIAYKIASSLLALSLVVGVLGYSQQAQAARATGGTITTDGDYTIHTFTENGTFTPDATLSEVEVLVVGGGGGGGTNVGGGGGGGGVVYDAAFAVTPESGITVTVGAATNKDTIGNNSVFSSLTANGGGKGGMANQNGGNGACGGGAGRYATGQGQGGTASQGYRGGNTTTGGGTGAAGGGGMGGQGVDWQASDGSNATAGGPGISNSISGSAVTYAAGGFGGPYGVKNGDAGAANTGNGGGGGGTGNGPGGAGGSGIVIVKYLTSSGEAPPTPANNVIINNGSVKLNNGKLIINGK